MQQRFSKASVCVVLTIALVVGSVQTSHAQTPYECSDECKNQLITLGILAAVGGVLIAMMMSMSRGRAARRAEAARNAPPSILVPYYETTTGQVAIRTEMRALAACGGGETWGGRAAHESGEMPPGLQLSDSDSRIVGTPELPGKWTVRIRFSELTCRGRTYSDQLLSVPIVIEP